VAQAIRHTLTKTMDASHGVILNYFLAPVFGYFPEVC
jgi:hypothetical protein